MKKILSSAVLLAAAAWFLPAAGQTIYRCGNSYGQQPCPGGAPVQADDSRSAAQRGETSEAAQRDAKAADAMQKARLKEEAQPVAAYIPAAKANADAGKPSDEKKPVLSKPKKPQYFTATAPKKPGETPAKKKAKKAKEPAA